MNALKDNSKKLTKSGYKTIIHFSRHFERQKKAITELPGYSRTQRLINQYKLSFAIGGAVVICLLLTVVSVSLYVITGTSKVDLSRPGYETARKKVDRSSDSQESDFEASGSLDGKIMADYLKKYTKQTRTLSEYDTFEPKLLDDSQLGLTSTTQVAPSDGSQE